MSEVKKRRTTVRLLHAYRFHPGSGFLPSSSLLAALGYTAGSFLPVCALVGGGGKTTTLFRLADELAEGGKRVLVTTTTHFQCLYPEGARLTEQSSEITGESWDGPVLVVGRLPAGTHGTDVRPAAGADSRNAREPAGGFAKPKLAMPSGLDDRAEVARLRSLCDVILYEADGAKCLPVKVPRKGEPVFLPGTALVIACMGLSAVGRTFADACFRFGTDGGWLTAPDGRPYAAEDIIDAYAAAQILTDTRGAAKGIPGAGAARYRILLNQADNGERLRSAEEIALKLPAGFSAICAATGYEGSWTRAVKEGNRGQ